MTMQLHDQVCEPAEVLAELDVPVDDRTRWSPLGSPMIDPEGTSDGAVALTMHRAVERVLTHRGTFRDLRGAAKDELHRYRDRDLAIVEALGNSKRRTQPWTGLRPDAVVLLRALLDDVSQAAATSATAGANTQPGLLMRAVEAPGIGLVLAEAVPFFVPATIAAGLMTSDPPDEALAASIRLPFPSVLVFFDAVPLGDVELDAGLVDVVGGAPIDPTSAALVGAVIATGPDGRGLDPVAHWIITYPVRDTHGVVTIPGVWSRSAQPGVIANLAALCTWGTWTSPPPDPTQLEGDEGTRSWRRSLKKGAVRRALSRGAIIGVRVVDLDALRSNTAGGAPALDRRRTVRTHFRRGYWNSVRVATRDTDGTIVGDRLGEQDVDWHYEGRWIHPTLVHGTDNDIVSVYAVPETPR